MRASPTGVPLLARSSSVSVVSLAIRAMPPVKEVLGQVELDRLAGAGKRRDRWTEGCCQTRREPDEPARQTSESGRTSPDGVVLQVQGRADSGKFCQGTAAMEPTEVVPPVTVASFSRTLWATEFRRRGTRFRTTSRDR